MKRSIKDEAKGTFHEVKGKVKEQDWTSDEQSQLGSREARSKRQVGRSKRKSAKWRESSENSRCRGHIKVIQVQLLIISPLARQLELNLINTL